MATSKPSRREFTEEELVSWTKVVPIDSLRPHPKNPNNGDQERINESLRRHGQFRAILVSEDGYVLAGNHTYAGKMEKGDKAIAVTVLPLMHDEPQAVEIMLADNHIGRKGKDDQGILLENIQFLAEVQGEVLGAGFTDQEFQRMISNDVNDEGLPAGLEYKVIVDCDSEAMQAELLDRFEKEGLKCRALIA